LKFQDTLVKRKRVLLCRNPRCDTNLLTTKKWHKKSLLGIKTLVYSTELEKLVFYVCSECGYYNFENFGKPITNQPMNLHVYIIQDAFDKDYEKMLKSRGPSNCLYCELKSIIDYDSEFVNKEKIEELENRLEFSLDDDQEQLKNKIENLKRTTKPVYKIKQSVYKLFIKGKPRRGYIGFLCLNCQSIYYDPRFKKVNWQNMNIKKVNPIKPLINVYEKKKELHLEYQKLKKRKTTANNEIRIQELETWENLQVKKPSKPYDYELKYLGLNYTGGLYEPRTERISLTLENLTIRQIKKAIKLFGTEEQKEEIERLGL